MSKLWLLLMLVTTAGAQMRMVEVDAAQLTGTIRSLQGVNVAPVAPVGT